MGHSEMLHSWSLVMDPRYTIVDRPELAHESLCYKNDAIVEILEIV